MLSAHSLTAQSLGQWVHVILILGKPFNTGGVGGGDGDSGGGGEMVRGWEGGGVRWWGGGEIGRGHG